VAPRRNLDCAQCSSSADSKPRRAAPPPRYRKIIVTDRDVLAEYAARHHAA
jgi:hypothetical protein